MDVETYYAESLALALRIMRGELDANAANAEASALRAKAPRAGNFCIQPAARFPEYEPVDLSKVKRVLSLLETSNPVK